MKTNHKSLSAETYFTWGNEKSKSGDYTGAIADYNTAIHLKPDFARAYYKRGKAKSELGNFSAAKSDLEIAEKLVAQIGDASLMVIIEQELRLSRITFDPGKCGGRPCIRGMRIRVTDVLGLLANGLSFKEILEEMPDLEAEDILACLQFAAHKMDAGESLVEIPDLAYTGLP